jgi:mannose-6-phosphate isomerase-like protein (cupin superfamily)
MYSMHVKDAKAISLPGREWKLLIGPGKGGCKNMVFGVVEFPPDSKPTAHQHNKEEEIIYVLSGKGKMVVGNRRENLEKDKAIFIPPMIDHRVIVKGKDPLLLISIFSPPLIPGSYDQKAG